MPARMFQAKGPRHRFRIIKTYGQTALKNVLIGSALLTLPACLGTTTTTSTFNRSLFSQSALVAPRSASTTASGQASLTAAAAKPTTLTLSPAPKTAPAEPAAPVKVAAAPAAVPVLQASGPAAPAAQTLSHAEGLIEPAGLIDRQRCTRGLQGELATGRAGASLLAANGLAGGESPADGLVSPLLASAEAAVDKVAPSAGTTEAPSSVASLNTRAGMTEALLIAAYQQAGRHYRDGGQNPAAGFDDTGFTRWVYGQRGINLPYEARSQISGGRQVAKEDLRPGDLVVYRDPSGKGNSFHVGIYTGQGNFLHAAAKAGLVTETAAFGPQYAPFFVGGRRYYDDPKATPLSDGQKMAAASSAVKLALSELGPNDKPQRLSSRPQPKAKAKKGK